MLLFVNSVTVKCQLCAVVCQQCELSAKLLVLFVYQQCELSAELLVFINSVNCQLSCWCLSTV